MMRSRRNIFLFTLKYALKESYDKTALVYDAYRLPWIEGPLSHLENSILRECLKDGLTLEVGIGTGRMVRYIVDKVQEYFGIDISFRMLQQCKNKVYGHKLELILADAENTCFKENSFDNLLAMKVFKFLEPSKFLKEAKRILKNDGILFIFVEVKDSLYFRLGEKLGVFIPKEEKHYYVREIFKMINNAGFKSVRATPVANILLGFYLLLWYLFFPVSWLRNLLSLLNKNPTFIKFITRIDRIIPSRFLVLFIASKP